MEEWLSVNIIPDLVNVRDALKELDKGSQTKLTRTMSAELLKIGTRIKQQEAESIMSTKIQGVKKSGQVRIKRGSREREAPLRAAIAAALDRRNRFTKKEAGVEVRVRRTPLGDRANLARKFNNGINRHPLFGDRKQWFVQVARPSKWWTRVIDDNKPQVTGEVQKIIVHYQHVVGEAMKGKKTT